MTRLEAGWQITSWPGLQTANGHSYIGAVTADDAIIVSWDGLTPSTTYDLGTEGEHTHNSAAILFVDGQAPVVAYSRHNVDSMLRIRIGSQPIGDGFTLGSETTVAMGASTTYARIHHHDGDLFVWTRLAGRSWGYIRSGNWGGSWDSPITVFQGPTGSGTSHHLYMRSKVTDAGVMHVAFQRHQDSATQDARYAQINLTTGAISTADGTVLGNLDDTGLPVSPSNMDLVASPTGLCRVTDVAYDGRVAWWDEDTGTYYVSEWNGSSWDATDVGTCAQMIHGPNPGGVFFLEDGSLMLVTNPGEGFPFQMWVDGVKWWESLVAPLMWPCY